MTLPPGWPYAAKAIIQHEYITAHLNIWVTFCFPMRRSSDPLAEPPVYDIMPPLALWGLVADAASVDIVDSAWQDEFTILLTSDAIASRPAEVTLEYNGPNVNLGTTWRKDWEPWGAIVSTDYTATIWQTGMIILWSGVVVDIPSGWQLCDGTNGTPNLRDKFIIGAGSTYAPGATGGNLTHTHAATQGGHTHSLQSGPAIGQGTAYIPGTTTATPSITVPSKNHLPPYYALCYIMKL